MSDDLLGWVLLAPLVGGLIGVGLWLVSRRRGASPQIAFWFDAAALVSICAGLLAGPILLFVLRTGATFSLFDLSFTSSPVARVVLPMAHVALLVAVFFSWDDSPEESTPRIRPAWLVWAAVGVAPLLAGALMISERTLQALFLFGVALIVAGAAISGPGATKGSSGSVEIRINVGGRLAGGLKHLALAAIATVLLATGATLIERYGLSLEKRSLLQLGLSLLSVGLLVRAGAMPFAGAISDLIRATPGVAILMLGAVAPAVVGVGLLLLSPIEGSLVSAPQTAWIASLGVLLAGIRALGVADLGTTGGARRLSPQVSIPVLAAMSVAAQLGWALFGVLSGSRMGATGAILLVANMAIAVPLVVISCRMDDRRQTTDDRGRTQMDGSADSEEGGTKAPKSAIRNGLRHQSAIGLAVGVVSLLGLPPFGGFAGMLMVAQSAANIGGVWLGVLLLGMLLLGVAWIRANVAWSHQAWSIKSIWGVIPLLIVILITAQLGLFLLSGQVAALLGNWAGIPWLYTP